MTPTKNLRLFSLLSSAWHSMHRLRRLSLSGNPVGRITNDSFVGLKHLEELDISGIQAESFQVGDERKLREWG